MDGYPFFSEEAKYILFPVGKKTLEKKKDKEEKKKKKKEEGEEGEDEAPVDGEGE